MKRILMIGLVVLMLTGLTACSNPKRDAKDTNIQQQMEDGTLQE